MLRLPTDAVWLGLGVRHAGMVRVQRGRAVPVASAAVDGTGPDGLMQAAGRLLDEHGGRGRKVAIVLSDRLVRYALLPFSAAHLDDAEDEALCRARFAEIYGPMPDWRLRAEPVRYGRARLACALAPELAQGLDALRATHALRAGPVVPHFVSCWNRRPAHSGRGPGMLAVIEADTLVMASFDRTGWRTLRAQYVDTRAGAVADLVLRERLLQRIEPDTPLWLAGTVAPDPDLDALGTVVPAQSACPGLALALNGAAR